MCLLTSVITTGPTCVRTGVKTTLAADLCCYGEAFPRFTLLLRLIIFVECYANIILAISKIGTGILGDNADIYVG